MFGAKAYAQVGIESGVESASPHGLILMLYDGAIQAIVHAQHHLEAGKVIEKCASIDKAIRIIDEGLKAALDVKAGGDLAEQLWLLYDYMARELILASSRNSHEKMAECIQLLRELRSAWADIGSVVHSS